MKKSKFYWIVPFLMTALFLTACGGTESSNEEDSSSEGNTEETETFTFQAGHSQTEEHPYHLALLDLAENVKERTNGNVTIEIFPLNQLGAERELTEALTFGTADMSISSTAPIANFYPQLGIVDLPFLFESREHAYSVLDGQIGQDLLTGLESTGLVGLAWAENGFRHITNGKQEITKPEDLKGLKIRTQENQIHLDAFEALGAQPTPMAWNEALTALQQGVVDAQENPLIIADTYKLHEANQTHMSLTGHIYSPAIIMFSKSIWDTVPSEYQSVLKEEAKIAGDKIRELSTQADEDSLQVVKDNGVKVVEDVDVAPFREAIQSVYEKYEADFGKENIDAILNGNE
ncbi:tripartite ATP-independent transporter solute receptor, DctP family [Mesobacillus persicus]|uniref:Tripartite ATP-independent transporter solute receptor, DctP family n=1 Tax=Mesobacillus persicus TaxID=930146 RepID=A0A1H7YXB8_9BACI|nr:TRAP transporter substrate-binding protein [Mesobacillus persicus]SEM50623.1 tripartite ATP-independent transporter solute receptor, DctP family [Mesobacillus persicus]